MPGKPRILSPIRKSIAGSQDFIASMRAFDQAHDACLAPPPGATLGQLAWFNIKRAVRFVGRELLYAAWTPVLVLMQVTLIVAFNLLAVMLLLRLVRLI